MIRGPQSRMRAVAIDGLHLAALWALAFAQPLFNLLGDNAAFFAIRGSEPVDIVVFAVGLVLVPPLVATLLLALAELIDTRLRQALQLALVALLVGAIVLSALEDLLGSGTSSVVLIGLALAVGVGAAFAYARFDVARSFLSVLSPVPLVFLVLFLFFSPVTDLVFPSDQAEGSVAHVASRTPVVMIVFDEFPVTSLLDARGRVDATRYPAFARLAHRSDWYRNTSTVHAGTEHAVPAILDSLWPDADALPILADHPRNLFTLLGGSHRVEAVEPVTRLCPRRLCGEASGSQGFGDRLNSLVADTSIVSLHLLLPDDLRRDLPSISNRWQDFGGEGLDSDTDDGAAARSRDRRGFSERFTDSERTRVGMVDRFVESIRPWRPGERPPLYFLHTPFPHGPWQYLPSGRQYGAAETNLSRNLDVWSKDPLGAALGQQRHLLQLRFTDRLLSGIMSRLRRTGLMNRSLVVVMADHGISFRAGMRPRELNPTTAPDISPVPLFIKRPGQQRGHVVDKQIRTIDVVPTMADLLGIRIPWHVDGRSALSAPPVQRLRIAGEGQPFRGFRAATLQRRRAAALRRQVRLFGDADRGAGLYELGPHPELIGRRVASLPTTAAASTQAHASIEQASQLTNVDPRSAFVPAHVTGDVSGGGTGTTDLALALNGTVRAVTRTLAGGGGGFAFMVPESSFRDGPNHVEVLRVSSTAEGLTVARLGDAGQSEREFTLSGDALRGRDGRVVRIDRHIRGQVESSQRVGPVVRLSGWAVQADPGKPVDRALTFVGRELVSDVAPRELDARAAELFDIPPFNLGWHSEIATSQLSRPEDVHVFAVAGANARRLPFHCVGGQAAAIGCPKVTLTTSKIRIAGEPDLRIERTGMRGFVESAGGKQGVVAGWALKTPSNRPVDGIIAFSNGRFVVSGAAEVPRPDVAAQFDTDPPGLGFRLESRARLIRPRDRVRVFAVSGGAAVPLKLSAGA